MAESKAVSLSFELETLMRATEAASLLARALQHGGLPEEHDEAVTPPAIDAVLDLVCARLRDLVRAIRGSADPGTFSAPHSAALPAQKEPGAKDVLLKAWSPDEIATHAERQLARVKVERRAKRRRGDR